jgi:hypothetical protein
LRLVSGLYTKLLVFIQPDVLSALNHHRADTECSTHSRPNSGTYRPGDNRTGYEARARRAADLDAVLFI